MGPFAMSKWRLASLASMLSFLFVNAARAQITVEETGLLKTGGSVYGAAQANLNIGEYLAKNVIQPLFGLSGVIFLAFIVYAGILWMTDQGDTDHVKKAKSIMVHSTIGLIIMLAAYAITDIILTLISQPVTPGNS